MGLKLPRDCLAGDGTAKANLKGGGAGGLGGVLAFPEAKANYDMGRLRTQPERAR